MNTTNMTAAAATDYTQLRGDARREAFLALIAASPAATELMLRLANQADAIIDANPWKRPGGRTRDQQVDDYNWQLSDTYGRWIFYAKEAGEMVDEQAMICDEILATVYRRGLWPRAANQRGIELIETLLTAGTIDVLRLAAAQQELELA